MAAEEGEEFSGEEAGDDEANGCSSDFEDEDAHLYEGIQDRFNRRGQRRTNGSIYL